jgi:hypothetical protein
MIKYKTMKTKIAIAMIIFSFAFVSGTLKAQCKDDRNDHNRYEDRIREGYRHGDLDGREAMQLKIQRERFEAAKQMALSDGKLSRREKEELKRMRKEMQMDMWQQKHDRQKRRF